MFTATTYSLSAIEEALFDADLFDGSEDEHPLITDCLPDGEAVPCLAMWLFGPQDAAKFIGAVAAGLGGEAAADLARRLQPGVYDGRVVAFFEGVTVAE